MGTKTNEPDFKQHKSLLRSLTIKTSAAWVAKVAMLTAIAFLLYYLGQFFKMPLIFPGFLDFQISELPAILAGFSMGPVSGCLVIVFKCLLKLPLSSTMFVGELTDMVMGIAYVLPASLWYHLSKKKMSSLHGMLFSSLFATAVGIVLNRFVSAPFYINLYFGGSADGLIGMLSTLYPGINADNFWGWYLGVGILPFNLLRYTIVSAITFFTYKRISKILHWSGGTLRGKDKNVMVSNDFKDANAIGEDGIVYTDSVEETYDLASEIASTLKGGEKIILDGDLGAGKTTFTKGLAKALDIDEEITSPTFTIMNEYSSGRIKLYHLDMYRIESEDDLYELGVEDAVNSDGVSVIEWNKFKDLTGRIINVKISVEGETRRKFEIEDKTIA